MRVAIIGGGAAGFFAAFSVKENYKEASVTIFEKSNQVLAKVKISGGGRCNLTNACDSIEDLCTAYPRGGKKLKKAFYVFSNKDTIKWFGHRKVPLVIQPDGCVFPKSQNSQTIIDCFLEEAKKLNVDIKNNHNVKKITAYESKYKLVFSNETNNYDFFDKVIITTGGSPLRNGLAWLEELNHKVENPVPSLFSFNMPNEKITQLMGIVVENALVSIPSTNFNANDALLITHWGMSGPAILKLSSFAARFINEKKYEFLIHINWINETNHNIVINKLNEIISQNKNKFLTSYRPFYLPERLWLFLLEKNNFTSNRKWGELGKKELNKLINILCNDEYKVKGKSTFKEEFVTCGGISLESINLNTMQSKQNKNMYFAGEVLDIDAITGGFNLQAAWTTGYIAGKLQD